MARLDVLISGDRQVAAKFENFPTDLSDALYQRITALTEELYVRILGAEPDRSGKLRGQTQKDVSRGDTRIRGRVFIDGRDPSDYGKAAALEYGLHRSIKVKPHHQRVRTVYGRSIAPTEAVMGAYNRTANIAARRFEREPLDQMRGTIEDQLKQAIIQAAEGEK